MSMRNKIKAASVGLALAMSLVVPTVAEQAVAASKETPTCERGMFCVWPDSSYRGTPDKFEGDDSNWGFGYGRRVYKKDSSWWNNGISGPGIKDHAQVFDRNGRRTICLKPGERVHYKASANDRGVRHTWTRGC